MAESVDASDLKSDRGSTSVPVQVWPGADKKLGEGRVFFNARLSLPVQLAKAKLWLRIQVHKARELACSFCKVWPGANKNSAKVEFF